MTDFEETETEYRFSCPRPRCLEALITTAPLGIVEWHIHHKKTKPRHTKTVWEKRQVTQWERVDEV